MKTNFLKTKKCLILLSALLAGVFLFVFVGYLCKTAFYTEEIAMENSKMYDECIPKAVVTMGYLNGIQLNAMPVGGKSYIMYCGISALKDHCITEDDRVWRTNVCDSMRIYFMDIKPYFLQNFYLRPDKNQMTALMALCARIGVGNFARRMQKLTPEAKTAEKISLIDNTSVVNEFFCHPSTAGIEVRQYFWVLAQLFRGKLTPAELYDYPVMSYRYLDTAELYKKNGRPRYHSDILKKYRHIHRRSVREEGIMPYSLLSEI